MARFDPKKFASKMDEYIEVADSKIKNQLGQELEALRGLNPDQIEQFGGTTEQLDNIMEEIKRAADENLKQAELIENLKNLGDSTYELAQKVSAVVR